MGDYRPTRSTNRPRLFGYALLALVGLAAAACTEEPTTATGTSTPAGGSAGTASTVNTGDVPHPEADSIVGRYAGEEWFAGTVPDEAVVAEGEPIKVGLMNQEDTPAGSYPEVREGAETAVSFINAELGGVGGRPIELVTCITNFSVERSQACAQEMVSAGVVAVLGGIDITSNGSIPVLEQNNIPYIGGIPINYDEMRSPISFQFSGGSPGPMVAFGQDAIDRGYVDVAVVYAEFGPVEASARYGIDLMRGAGIDVHEVSYPILSTDMLPVMTEAASSDPQGIVMFAADAACAPAMQIHHDLDMGSTLYMVGSCAAPAIIEEAGDAAEGLVFGIETLVSGDNVGNDNAMYQEIGPRYGPEGFAWLSVGTVSFRGTMNLWVAMNEVGVDNLSPDALITWFQGTVDQPSYDGHPYTCDGKQVPDLPALCAPQQVLARIEGGQFVPHSDGWVDVAAILSAQD